MNTLEKADKFLQYKFLNVNYLLEINYKVGNLIDLQDDLQDYIANNEPELHQEFMDSTQLDIDDIIVQCSEYYRNYDDLDNYRSFTNTIFYGLFHEFSAITFGWYKTTLKCITAVKDICFRLHQKN